MRLSEIEGERALDVLAEIIDPVAEICADKEIAASFKSEPRLLTVKKVLKTHKAAIIKILATLDGEEPENYRFTLLSLPQKLMELINDPEVEALFTSQSQTKEDQSSGSVTESTKGGKK